MITREVPTWVMLSGLPCTGKSTWRTQFTAVAKAKNLNTTIISSDDLALDVCAEYNKEHVHYNGLFKNSALVAALEEKYANAVVAAKTSDTDIIILDRTYMTVARRKAMLDQLGAADVHVAHFKINDEATWKTNLNKRNTEHPDKLIDDAIIAKLNTDATSPQLSEGFRSVATVLPVGENGFENSFSASIADFIRRRLLISTRATSPTAKGHSIFSVASVMVTSFGSKEAPSEARRLG
jgi:predicted kinase